MKAATRGSKPEWFRAPAGIVSATVCRLSGLLASEGCNHADHQEPVEIDGKRRRPYVYTELFARGTEPTSYCTVHALTGIQGAVATVFTVAERPATPRLEDRRLSPPPPAVVAAAEDTAAPPTIEKAPEPPKKRGFWSRVFGIGGDRGKQKDNDRDER
jgi:penicillin-binding protein 1A